MTKFALWIAAGMLVALPVLAEELTEDIPPTSPPEAAEARAAGTGDDDEIEWLEDTRKGVYDASYWLVEGVDSWFGDKPFEESGGRVSGEVYLRGLYREDDGFKERLRYRLRVTMPNVSERAVVVIGRENEAELVTGQQETFSRSQLLLPESQSGDSTFFAGLGYLVRDNVDLRIGVRGGYRLYAQARYKKDFMLTERSGIHFSETIFLAVRDGFGSTTGLNFNQVLTEASALRWRNSVTFSTETDGLEWQTAFGTVHAFARQRELSLDLLANGATDAPVDLREYGVRGIYRQPIYREWLFGELILGHFWPQEDEDPDRRKSWALGAALELRF